jgi:PTS system N-acetylglucosamine-specific IIB component
MDQAANILAALGGVANIIDIEPCTTRLRSEVHDPTLVDVPALRAAGAPMA